MKNKNRFSSYAEALKRLELVKGQENLQEATKYVLKQNKPTAEPTMDAAPSEVSPEIPAEPEAPMPDEMGGEAPIPDEMGGGTEEPMPDDMGGEESTDASRKPSDYMAEVQKFAGKLGQELRDQKEKMESDDIKYVLNMIISAVNLDNLEEEDIEEIAKKFERDEDFGDEEIPSEEPEMEDEEIPAEDDLSEIDTMDALESFINTPIDNNEIDLSKYSDIDENMDDMDDIQELDLDEIKNEINRTVGETLSKYFK